MIEKVNNIITLLKLFMNIANDYTGLWSFNGI